jgi:integrase
MGRRSVRARRDRRSQACGGCNGRTFYVGAEHITSMRLAATIMYRRIKSLNIGIDCGTHSLRRTKASVIYKAGGNLRAIQILLGHTKIESMVRHLGVDVEDALIGAENTDV